MRSGVVRHTEGGEDAVTPPRLLFAKRGDLAQQRPVGPFKLSICLQVVRRCVLMSKNKLRHETGVTGPEELLSPIRHSPKLDRGQEPFLHRL